jgi:hypothetical protein
MTSTPILSRLTPLKQVFARGWQGVTGHYRRDQRPNLHQLAQNSHLLPRFVRESPVAMRYLRLLGLLDWGRFPERDLETDWGTPAVPYASFAAAGLVKLNQQLVYVSHLRQYLCDHPALVWILGFPVVPSFCYPWGFDVQVSLPSARHFTRMLRRIPNAALQSLLDQTVHLLQAELSTEIDDFGQAISLDTKHIVAWVRENNPKDYVQDRYDKTKRPAGDPDCRLGCKRRRNQRASSKEPPATPPDNPVPANTIAVAEYYWGYASGVVATKVPGWGEFVLAELTLPFDQPDVAYFHPLMADVQRRLGFRPRYCALDAAFDAFYIYEYFHRDGEPIEAAFAAVPLSKRGRGPRQFDAQGWPLCQAGLPMPIRHTYTCHTTRFEHVRGRHVCPLRFPEVTASVCPVGHKNWPRGGCTTTIPISIGARIRYQLDRGSTIFKAVYKQRTATERINSQAKELGIERPRLRNGQAIANQNTLIYVLINLRALHRVGRKKASRDSTA